jgi:CheY-like chemotaxis protein
VIRHGREAVEEIYVGGYDAVLLNESLPDIDPIEVIPLMRAWDNTTGIVFLSAYPERRALIQENWRTRVLPHIFPLDTSCGAISAVSPRCGRVLRPHFDREGTAAA